MIERLWEEMEAEGGSVWRLRRARKQGTHPLVIALEPGNQTRVLLVPVPGILLPPRREWPECRGLEWMTVELESIAYWGVRLRDANCTGVFTALARDLDARLALASGTEQAAAELFGRLKLWQQFLKAWQDGLGPDARRGLWGELHVLYRFLMPALGSAVAVGGWKGSSGAHQDFQFPHAAVEIKTTSAKQPQSIRITSERQLDDTGAGALFLLVIIVDEREVSMGESSPGMSLPALVRVLRERLAGEHATLALFNDHLFHRGWLDEHVPRYESQRLTVREELAFRVVPGFPRLLEHDLLPGIGDVNYALNLAACASFRVTVGDLVEILAAAS